MVHICKIALAALISFQLALVSCRSSTPNEDIPVARALAAQNRGDKEGSIDAWNEVILKTPAPYRAFAYTQRGQMRFEVGDKYAAIADYDAAVIDQNMLINLYLQEEKKDIAKSSDGSRRLKKQIAYTYFMRSKVKFDLKDKNGSITDLQMAAQIYQEFGDTENLQKATQAIEFVKGN